MNNITQFSDCYGCGMCAIVCPKQIISIQQNINGFYEPVINNDNEYVYRHIDEAGIKQAETDRMVRMKQMEMAEKNRESAEKTKV